MKSFNKALGTEIQQQKCERCKKNLEPNIIYVRTKDGNTTHLNLVLVCAEDYAIRVTNLGESITTSLWTGTWNCYDFGASVGDEPASMFCSTSCANDAAREVVTARLQRLPFIDGLPIQTAVDFVSASVSQISSNNFYEMKSRSKKAADLFRRLDEARIYYSAN